LQWLFLFKKLLMLVNSKSYILFKKKNPETPHWCFGIFLVF
jgi:hypothetical protein